MFKFTADFHENDIYLNKKYAYNINGFLVEILNENFLDIDFTAFELEKLLPKVMLYKHMEFEEIDFYDKNITLAQCMMSQIDEFFSSFSIATFISSSESQMTTRLYNLLNSYDFWETGDTSDISDEEFYNDDFCNDYGFVDSTIDKYGYKRYKFNNIKFVPDIDFINDILEFDEGMLKFNSEVQILFNRYINFVNDMLRVKEVYANFIDNYLHTEKKYLDSNALAEKYIAFLEELKKKPDKPYYKFKSGSSTFGHSVIETEQGKIFCESYVFETIGAFLYYDFFRGIDRNYIPKKCYNCGKYFLLKSSYYNEFCDNIAPGQKKKTCQDVGSRKKYDDKCKNDPVWQTYNRAYKAHYARYMKKKMTISEFEKWSAWAIVIRDKVLRGEMDFDEYSRELKK